MIAFESSLRALHISIPAGSKFKIGINRQGALEALDNKEERGCI